MAVPYTFASATSAIPLSQLDANFATTITLGNTAIQLGNTVTTLNNMTLANATVSSGNVTVTSASLSGNLTFTGTGNRITGDFSNATAANRVMFQTSTANSATIVGVIPNGTSTNAQLWCFGSSDPANTSVLQLAGGANTNTEVRIASNITGTGTYLPMTFYTNGSERMRLDTNGYLGIGTNSPGQRLDLAGGSMTLSSSTGTQQFYLYRFSATNYASIGTDSSAGGITFTTGTSSPSERMRIDSSGNVGIGTNSPGAKLQVNGNTAQYSASVAVRTPPNQYEWGHSNTSGYGSVIGAESGSGAPFIAFSAGAGTNSNTYRTYGIAGCVIKTDNAGGLTFNSVTNANADNQTTTERMRIDSSGNVLVTNPAGLGYGTGSGGTVTQATSKATAVTLNKPTGQIITAADALAANTVVNFTFTNSLLSIYDNLVLTFNSNSVNIDKYNVWASVNNGSAVIYLKNISAGSLSEAKYINFAIIKGATS